MVKEVSSEQRPGEPSAHPLSSLLSPESLDFLLAAEGLPIAGSRTFPILEHALPCLKIRLVKKLKSLAGIKVLE